VGESKGEAEGPALTDVKGEAKGREERDSKADQDRLLRKRLIIAVRTAMSSLHSFMISSRRDS